MTDALGGTSFARLTPRQETPSSRGTRARAPPLSPPSGATAAPPLLQPAPRLKGGGGVRLGIGSSSSDDGDAAAVDEAWDAVLASLEDHQPEFVAVFCSPHVDGDAALGALRTCFCFPRVPFEDWSCTR